MQAHAGEPMLQSILNANHPPQPPTYTHRHTNTPDYVKAVGRELQRSATSKSRNLPSTGKHGTAPRGNPCTARYF